MNQMRISSTMRSYATADGRNPASVEMVNLALLTLPKTSIAPENDGFQQESSFPGVHFQVLC